MEDRERTRTDENAKKLAGEMKVNDYVTGNKTLVNIFPEMHAIPEYVQKAWVKEQAKMYGDKTLQVMAEN